LNPKNCKKVVEKKNLLSKDLGSQVERISNVDENILCN
jgi:hypothetical protein